MMQTENDSMAGLEPGSRSLTLQTLSQTLQDAEDYLKNQEIRELWKGKQNEEKKTIVANVTEEEQQKNRDVISSSSLLTEEAASKTDVQVLML